MSKSLSYTTSLLICIIMIGTALHFGAKKEEVLAQEVPPVANLITNPIKPIPFAGKITEVELCCNGIKLEIEAETNPLTRAVTGALAVVTRQELYQSPIEGTMIFEWKNMAVIPDIGWGLYRWWSLKPDTTVLGTARVGGVCQIVASECLIADPVDYSIQQMGTNLIDIDIPNIPVPSFF